MVYTPQQLSFYLATSYKNPWQFSSNPFLDGYSYIAYGVAHASTFLLHRAILLHSSFYSVIIYCIRTVSRMLGVTNDFSCDCTVKFKWKHHTAIMIGMFAIIDS